METLDKRGESFSFTEDIVLKTKQFKIFHSVLLKYAPS